MSKKFRFHDLRHTYASHHVMNDGNLKALQKLMGHKSFETTQRYAHLSKDYMREQSNEVSFDYTDRLDSTGLSLVK